MNTREKSIAGMKYFNKVLRDNDFVSGDNFTAADITLFAGLAFADFAGVEIPSECTNLQAWRSKVAERPSIAA